MATVINSSTTGLIVTPDATGQLTLSANGVTALTANTTGYCTFTNDFASVAGYPAYQCRAWVNFNGTSTVAIRGSGNVSSITDNGTGDYTVNFSNAMPDGNYAVAGTAMFSSSINDHFIALGDTNGAGGTLPSTTAVRFRTMYNNAANTPQDCTYVTIMVVR